MCKRFLPDFRSGTSWNQQPPTAADAAGLIEPILGVSYRGVAAKDSAAAVLNDRLRADLACGQQPRDERAGSYTSYSKAAAQKSARAGASVLSMTNFQPSGTRPVSRESNDPSNRRKLTVQNPRTGIRASAVQLRLSDVLRSGNVQRTSRSLPVVLRASSAENASLTCVIG
jgi:hypothetical protein